MVENFEFFHFDMLVFISHFEVGEGRLGNWLYHFQNPFQSFVLLLFNMYKFDFRLDRLDFPHLDFFFHLPKLHCGFNHKQLDVSSNY